MLNYISLKNFRAYRDERFDFSKINIFMGPNNSGKSSVLSAINLLAQSSDLSFLSSSPITLNGPYDELGTYIDVVHGNRSNSNIGIEFGFSRHQVSFEVKYRSQRKEIELSRFTHVYDSHQNYSYYRKRDAAEIRIGNTNLDTLINDKQIKTPRINGFWPTHQNLAYLHFDEDNFELPEEFREKLRILEHSQYDVYRLFRTFDSLSPFRDKPKRTYLYTGEVANNIGRNGSNGINLIVNDSSKRGAQKIGILDEVNRWFRVTGIAKGLRVRNLTPRHFEICVIDFDNKEHNICDVGFGCSQVLPVLVAGLNLHLQNKHLPRMNKTWTPMLVVQEPEIHLHPNAQAALGSFFVGLANMGGQLFLETHSDHLVIRIARHIARGELSPDDVNIYFVDPSLGNRKITKINFDENGIFEQEWPGGFMPHRSTETLGLARDRNVKDIDESSNEQLAFKYL